MNDDRLIWIDLKNSHEPAFFKSLTDGLSYEKFLFTARDIPEILNLCREYSIPALPIERSYSKNAIGKLLSTTFRSLRLMSIREPYSYAIGFHNPFMSFACKLRLKRCKFISISDNERSRRQNAYYFPFTDVLILPSAISDDSLKQYNPVLPQRIIHFDGYKEDIYLADYFPCDRSDLDVPFTNFVVLRPVAQYANYLRMKKNPTSELIEDLVEHGLNIVYLPRFYSERPEPHNQIYVPENTLKGLDLCYHSDAVISGSGTMVREAARMNQTSISYYPGPLLSVDKRLIEDGKVHHSSDTGSIIEHIEDSAKGKRIEWAECKVTKRELTQIVQEELG